MAQHDYDIANQSFPSFRTDLNNVLAAIRSTNSGSSAPSTPFANQLWYDSSANILYIRNEDNDANIALFSLDQSNDVSALLATLIDVQDASGTNTAGTNLTIRAGASTGNAAGGSIKLEVADGGSSGSSVNAHATALTVLDDKKVLVGKGASDTGTAGIELRDNGQLVATLDGGTPAVFNRLTDDGAVVKILQAGATDGQINTKSGDMAIGTGDTGVRFNDNLNAIQPFNLSTNAFINNTVDLGTSGATFAEAFIQGGVRIGGTSSSHLLDDYEEGTFTPTYFITSATFNMSLQQGVYTKIGNMVHVSIRIRGQRSGGSGVLLISGLPFTSESTTNINAACSIGFTNNWTTSPKGAIVANNGTSISFRKSGSSSALSNIADDVIQSDVSTGSTSHNDLIISAVYRTA
jgi:hypothetical protein